MKRIQLGCPEVSPIGGHRYTYLEVPEEYPDVATIDDPEVLVLELQLAPTPGIPGYRIVQEEPDGSVFQEYNMAPDVMYELFIYFQKIDRLTFPEGNPHA